MPGTNIGSRPRPGPPREEASAPSVSALAWSAWVAPTAVFGIALAIRLAHVLAIRGAPFFTLLMGDSRGYDVWAQRIAGGDWIGSDVFYQAPLYPYFLGTLYTLVGRDLLLVRIAQAVVGACSCALLADAGRRLFSRRVGIVAGMVLALYAPAIFFDGLMQKAVLDVFFVCLVLWVIARIESDGKRPPSGRLWLGLGLAVGGLALTRENALVLAGVILAWILVRTAPSATRLRGAAAFVGGVALVLAPVAIRNSVVARGFYLTTSQLGPNLYIGNHASANGTYQPLRFGRATFEYEREDARALAEQALGRRLSPAEVSRYWVGRAVAFAAASPAEWLRLTARKVAMVANDTEVIDTEDQATHAEWSPPLRLFGPLGRFGVLLPLGVLGAALTWSERRRYWVLYALTFAYAGSVVLFYVFARYRYPLVPFLTLFAAVGIVGAAEAIRSALGPRLRQSRKATSAKTEALSPRAWMTTGAAVVTAAVFANWPLVSATEMRAVSETNLSVVLLGDRRPQEAIDHARRAIEARPDYAPAYSALGAALRANNEVGEAARAYEQALTLLPGFTDARYNLGNLLLDRGDAAGAALQFEQALRDDPGSAEAHNNLGIALAGSGRTDDAIAEFQRAIALDSTSAKPHRNLGHALWSKGNGPGAIAAYRRSVALDPRNAATQYDLAQALLAAGQVDEAVVAYRTVVALAPNLAEGYNGLGSALGSQGKLDEAILEFRRALEISPDFEQAQSNLATTLRMKDTP